VGLKIGDLANGIGTGIKKTGRGQKKKRKESRIGKLRAVYDAVGGGVRKPGKVVCIKKKCLQESEKEQSNFPRKSLEPEWRVKGKYWGEREEARRRRKKQRE